MALSHEQQSSSGDVKLAFREPADAPRAVRSYLSRCAFPQEAEIGIALCHERQVRTNIHAAVAERMAVLMAIVKRVLLFSCTSCNDVLLVRKHCQHIGKSQPAIHSEPALCDGQ